MTQTPSHSSPPNAPRPVALYPNPRYQLSSHPFAQPSNASVLHSADPQSPQRFEDRRQAARRCAVPASDRKHAHERFRPADPTRRDKQFHESKACGLWECRVSSPPLPPRMGCRGHFWARCSADFSPITPVVCPRARIHATATLPGRPCSARSPRRGTGSAEARRTLSLMRKRRARQGLFVRCSENSQISFSSGLQKLKRGRFRPDDASCP